MHFMIKKEKYMLNYPGKVPHLASLDIETGKIKKLKDIKGPTLMMIMTCYSIPLICKFCIHII